ncbi:PhzF family phenazine biosynthesis protein [Streptomyces sp. NPDC005438]|uniref:PhzF family phenazine biosynthesis protein n=1 Tax=Streptomyces sp. NPDC005438 TaxID=3156880 RepID=UPI0033B0F4C9
MRARIVDAFTDRPFTGNPAAVLLWEAGPFPGDDQLRLLAQEFNLSETAFAHPLPEDDEADWALRWFTPVTEVRLCGHATLATAHVLASESRARGTVRFRTLSGVLSARIAEDGALTLDFPTAPLTEVAAPAQVAEALGAEVTAAWDTGPQVGDLLVELADEATVRGLTPDLGALARLDHRGVIVTARAGETEDCDYVSRFFGPAVGVPEDPVTGSAHTALAPLWSGRLERPRLVGRQLSARGGTVVTTLDGDRTLLTGRAVTVLDGRLLALP